MIILSIIIYFLVCTIIFASVSLITVALDCEITIGGLLYCVMFSFIPVLNIMTVLFFLHTMLPYNKHFWRDLFNSPINKINKVKILEIPSWQRTLN